MEKYFSVSGNQIPVEYKSLYQEISKTFERKVADAIKFSKEEVNEQVKRNQDRFPDDFMFQLTHQEFDALQVSYPTNGNQKYRPYVFTENGVAMP